MGGILSKNLDDFPLSVTWELPKDNRLTFKVDIVAQLVVEIVGSPMIAAPYAKAMIEYIEALRTNRFKARVLLDDSVLDKITFWEDSFEPLLGLRDRKLVELAVSQTFRDSLSQFKGHRHRTITEVTAQLPTFYGVYVVDVSMFGSEPANGPVAAAIFGVLDHLVEDRKDKLHLYTAIVNCCDFLLTKDATHFLRRQKEIEECTGVVVCHPDEFISTHADLLEARSPTRMAWERRLRGEG